MAPVAPLLIGVLIALRYIAKHRSGDDIKIRVGDLGLFGAWVWLFLFFLMVISAEHTPAELTYGILGSLALPLAFPSLPARLILRWKMLNLAFWSLRALGLSTLRMEPVGGASVLLLHHHADAGAAHLDRIAQRLEKVRVALPITVLAWALLHQRRNEEESARSLMTLLSTLPRLSSADPTRIYARLWLQGEAAARGDWDEVDRLGHCGSRRGGGDPRPARILAEELHARRAGTPGSRWRWGFPFAVLRAIDAAPLLPSLPEDRSRTFRLPPALASADPLARARWLSAALERAPQAHPAQFRQVGRAWDEALRDPALKARLAERAAAVGALREPEDLLLDLREPARVALVARIGSERPHLELGAEEGLLADALAEVREPLIDRLQDLIDDLDRLSATQAEDWLRLARIQALTDWLYATGGVADRAWLYQKVFFKTLNHAVDAFNVQKQTPYAFVAMCWLHTLAESEHDQYHIDLMEENLKIPLGV